MKRVAVRALRRAVTHTLGTDRVGRLLGLCARAAGVDLLAVAYKQNGILNYENFDVSGEEFVLTQFLSLKLAGARPTVLDVGANVGDYAKLVLRAVPGARVFAFEPNPETFKILQSNVAGTDVRCVPLGAGSREEGQTLYVYPDHRTAPHASIHRELLTGFHRCAEPTAIACAFTTVDAFCEREGLSKINLLKIDAEGNELDVVCGAKRMIEVGAVDCIQFEFGEGNVYSRSFIRDFYHHLEGYQFFRICQKRLMPLREYSPLHEIFRFQNILAVAPLICSQQRM